MNPLSAVRNTISHRSYPIPLRFSALSHREPFPPGPTPPKSKVTLPKNPSKNPFKVLPMLLGAVLGIYSANSVDKTNFIEEAVVDYPGFRMVISPDRYFLAPPGLASVRKYELRDQAMGMDVEAVSKDGKPVSLRFEVVWRFGHEPADMKAIDKIMAELPPEVQEGLYLHNWGRGGTDKNAVVFFAAYMRGLAAVMAHTYIKEHDAAHFTPENANTIADALLKGFKGAPVKEGGEPREYPGMLQVAKELYPEIHIQNTVITLGNGRGTWEGTR